MDTQIPYEATLNIDRNTVVKLQETLRKLISSNGITITHLSRATKVPLQTMHGWLQGVAPKNISQVKKVADYFKITIDELCFGTKVKSDKDFLNKFENEINAGVFEVVLRRVK